MQIPLMIVQIFLMVMILSGFLTFFFKMLIVYAFRRAFIPVISPYLSFPFYKKFFVCFVGLCILSAILAGCVHLVLVNSKAFDISKDFIKDSGVLADVLGNIKTTSIYYEGDAGNRLSFNNTGGVAEFSIYAKGSKSEGIIIVNLEKISDNWTVTKAVLLEKKDGLIIKE